MFNIISYLLPRSIPRAGVKIAECFSSLNHFGKSGTNLDFIRFKSKGKRKIDQETETESESEGQSYDEDLPDKHSKIMKVNVPSPRTDSILKAGLGVARSKIEVMFYESKIRLNGEKLLKKSEQVQEGDEIDVIKGVSMNNPEHLTVARLEIISLAPKSESYSVKLKRYKSLLVENYKDKWKPTKE